MIGVTATGVATIATLAGCSASGSSPTVTMQGMKFQPSRLPIAPGTTVEWENDSDVPHSVTAYEDRIPDAADYFASGGFETERAARNDVSGGLIEPGDTFRHTFDEPGDYQYYCIPHESGGMVAEVVVD